MALISPLDEGEYIEGTCMNVDTLNAVIAIVGLIGLWIALGIAVKRGNHYRDLYIAEVKARMILQNMDKNRGEK